MNHSSTKRGGMRHMRGSASSLSLAWASVAAIAFAMNGCGGDDDATTSSQGAHGGTGGSAGKGGASGKGGKGGNAGRTGEAGASEAGSGGRGGGNARGGSSGRGTGGHGEAGTGNAPGGAGETNGGQGNGGESAGETGNGGAQGEAGATLIDPGSFDGQQVFRFDTFGDDAFWTDTLRLNEAIESALDPTTALSLGLKVDAAALPAGILDTADLSDPATTVALIGLNAVVGVQGTVSSSGRLTSVGITCALCHSSVDDSVAPGIGLRLDGQANHDLDPGAIIALSPGLAGNTAVLDVYNSWGPGFYDPRYSEDGMNHPVVIPSIYGLSQVPVETYTGDGPVSYWNSYVAVTQMHGIGTFFDPRIDVAVIYDRDLVTPKLPALFDYEMTLTPPAVPSSAFDADAAARGHTVFTGSGQCSTCHSGPALTDAASKLHAASETGMDPITADRSATGLYRTTPLRALLRNGPYFHDGSAATLADVVTHYDAALSLGLSTGDKSDLVEYLKSL